MTAVSEPVYRSRASSLAFRYALRELREREDSRCVPESAATLTIDGRPRRANRSLTLGACDDERGAGLEALNNGRWKSFYIQ